MISVITPTIRPEGLEIVEKALLRQTIDDFEWLIVTPLPLSEVEKYSQIPTTVVINTPPKSKGEVWTLNRDYNSAIKSANGDLIVSWQDYTFADPDALERFLFAYREEPTALVSGVGNKYTAVYPELGEEVWTDPRTNYQKPSPSDIEWNFCSVPKQALYDIGGFDESLDFEGYGMDGFFVNWRLHFLGGYQFRLDPNIRSYSLTHGRVEDWDKHNLIAKQEEYLTSYKARPVLEYLKG